MVQRNLRDRASGRGGFSSRLMILTCVVAGSGTALAQSVNGTLQYGPLGGTGPDAITPTAVPAVGGSSLILLSILFLLTAWHMQRSGKITKNRILSITLIGCALGSGLGGVTLIDNAMAQAEWFRDMTNPSGGTLTFEPSENACVRNATDVPLQVLSMSGVAGHPVQPTEVCGLVQQDLPEAFPGCDVGSILTPGDVCGALADSQQNEEPSDPPPQTTFENQAEQLVGPQGGTLQLGDVTLTIPVGALESETTIGMAISSGPIQQPNGSLSMSSPLITLTPHGQTFVLPVTLSFPYSLVEENPALYRLDDELDTTWELLPGSLTEGLASAQLNSFSIVGVWGERQSQQVTYSISLSASNFVRTNRQTGQVLPGEGEPAPVDPFVLSFNTTFDISQLTPGTPADVTLSGGLSLINDQTYHEFNPICCPWLDLKYLDRSYTELNMPLLSEGDGGLYTVYLTLHSLLHDPQVVDFHFDQSLFAGNFVEVKTWRPRQGSITITGPTGSFTRSLISAP